VGLNSINLKHTEKEVRLPERVHRKAPFFAVEMGDCKPPDTFAILVWYDGFK
jgi:hypothetical protein